jgi:hypothetical protein
LDKVTARRRGRRIIIIKRRRRNGAKTISLQTLCGDLIIIRNGFPQNLAYILRRVGRIL